MKNVPTKQLKSLKKKSKHKRRVPRVLYGVGATQERARQNGGIVREYSPDDEKSGRRVERHRGVYECQLDYYLDRKKLDIFEFKAGMRFREAWQFHAHGIRTVDSTSFERIDNAVALTPEEKENRRSWAERTLYQADKEAGLSIGQTLIIRRVCGEDEPIRLDASMQTLTRALEKLAVFWGYKPLIKKP